jgi:alpha-ribazole phosphatase
VLIVVRHGQTEANAAGHLLGRTDVALTELGRQQASRVATALQEFDIARVVSSPLRRARETAQALGHPVVVDDRWIELDYGEFEGRPVSGVPAEDWARWRNDLEFAPPGGESLADLGRRVRAACDDLVPLAREENVVVVSHVSPVKAALAWALGVSDSVSWRSYVAVASIMRIGFGGSGPSLRSFNEVGHLT